MKVRAFIGSLALVSSIAMAAVVPSSEVAKVNSFVKTLLGPASDMVSIEFSKAERSADGKRVEAVRVSISSQDFVKIDLDAKFTGNDFILNGILEGDVAKQEMNEQTIADTKVKIENLVQRLNSSGDFVASLKIQELANGKVLSLKIDKERNVETKTLKSLSFEMTYPKDLQKGKFKAILKSVFDAKATDVVTAQDAASNIFNAAASSSTPDAKDFQKLIDLFQTLLTEIE